MCNQTNMNPYRMIFSVEVSQVDTHLDSSKNYNFQVQGIDMLMEKVNNVIKSEHNSAQIIVSDEKGDWEIFQLAFTKDSKLVWETFSYGRGPMIWKTKINKL